MIFVCTKVHTGLIQISQLGPMIGQGHAPIAKLKDTLPYLVPRRSLKKPQIILMMRSFARLTLEEDSENTMAEED